MPCYDAGPSAEDLEYERRVRDGKTKALCRACAILKANGLLPDYLSEWDDIHGAVDEARDVVRKTEELLADALRLARSQGYDLNWEHPARVRNSVAVRCLGELETAEMQALAKLADPR